MKDLIICFSGTGNSYYVAQQIAKSQNHDNIVMINEISIENFEMPERLGIIFPIHMSREPFILEKKIRELLSTIKDFKSLQFVYAISTAGSNSPGWAHIRVEKMLKDFGVTTTYVNNVKMPDNVINPPNTEKSEELFISANIKINQIIQDIEAEKIKFPKFKVFTRTFTNISFLFNRFYCKHYSSKFTVTDDCTNCRLCYTSCPAYNITFENGKPVFHDQCYACTACINNCPTNAIRKKKDNGKRYKNPRGIFSHSYRS
jgi:ferredoxin/flavodoxin